jgi:uncharacterized membrane protein
MGEQAGPLPVPAIVVAVLLVLAAAGAVIWYRRR